MQASSQSVGRPYKLLQLGLRAGFLRATFLALITGALFCAVAVLLVLASGHSAHQQFISLAVSPWNPGQSNHPVEHFSDDCGWHSLFPLHQDYSNFEGPEEDRIQSGQYTPMTIDCPVCGHHHVTIAKWNNVREDGLCPVCGASNRVRQQGLAATQFLSVVLGARVHSVREIQQHQQLRIFNTQCGGAIHDLLRNHTGYVCSEYMGPEYASGTMVRREGSERGVRHEDLQQTSFESNSFDLVLSTEVFEHIPEPYQAHREVHRILRPGGAHVFTVPFYSNRYEDDVRASLAPNGSVVFHGEPEYHGDPLRKDGILVFTISGQHMVDKVCQIGFRVRVMHLRIPMYGILGGNSFVWVAMK